MKLFYTNPFIYNNFFDRILHNVSLKTIIYRFLFYCSCQLIFSFGFSRIITKFITNIKFTTGYGYIIGVLSDFICDLLQQNIYLNNIKYKNELYNNGNKYRNGPDKNIEKAIDFYTKALLLNHLTVEKDLFYIGVDENINNKIADIFNDILINDKIENIHIIRNLLSSIQYYYANGHIGQESYELLYEKYNNFHDCMLIIPYGEKFDKILERIKNSVLSNNINDLYFVKLIDYKENVIYDLINFFDNVLINKLIEEQEMVQLLLSFITQYYDKKYYKEESYIKLYNMYNNKYEMKKPVSFFSVLNTLYIDIKTDDCEVCKETLMGSTNRVIILACGHSFHYECLYKFDSNLKCLYKCTSIFIVFKISFNLNKLDYGVF